jgi:enoyl-CoA hydratase
VAGGLELALWCDLRIATSTAVFGCFERRFGVPLVDGGTPIHDRCFGIVH